MRLNLDRLPATARRLAEIIGLDATLALVNDCGGRTIWPTKGGDGHAHLVEIVGEVAADILVKHFREPVPVPKCDDALRAAVRESIRDEFDRLTKQEKYSARAAVHHLAGRPPLRYTDRHIWRILSSVDTGRVVDVAQGELF